MPLDVNHFIRLRPYLFHLTARNNIVYIRQDMLLKPSHTLFNEAGEATNNGRVRRGPRWITIGSRTVHIRDQDPLHAGRIAFSAGWTLQDLLKHLDNHVFFWPGCSHGPVSSGKNHFERYRNEHPVVLRVVTRELFEANHQAEPLFCRYNSGAPRCTMGKGSPRGPTIFLNASSP